LEKVLVEQLGAIKMPLLMEAEEAHLIRMAWLRSKAELTEKAGTEARLETVVTLAEAVGVPMVRMELMARALEVVVVLE
jgi:hypothetical protein